MTKVFLALLVTLGTLDPLVLLEVRKERKENLERQENEASQEKMETPVLPASLEAKASQVVQVFPVEMERGETKVIVDTQAPPDW